jgi:hypothetical protein
MSVKDVINELQTKLGLTMHGLNKRLKLKSSAHIWLLKKGLKKPGIDTCYKFIKLGREEGINITIDQLIDK